MFLQLREDGDSISMTALKSLALSSPNPTTRTSITTPLLLHCTIKSAPVSCVCVCVQGHALEQGHYTEGISGLYQEAAEGSATRQRAGDPAKETGDC